ncbi:hypothetical protein [Geothermobacter hydrogeniphilus]|uniref:RND transporter n=1 Tax=Geothermobacter hydrogeniphilus TaxID=1969733 RepID=A0A1X0YE99_9BACT|nr:hypothetical protein [Geothermobacter hydrogeniphilus]ORJ63413.1 hypothetical protein B5V00_00680 [Geothermobacter hydrogeniphilus]
MKFLLNIPLPLLLIATILIGLAPFSPEPHLVEKLRMLFAGHLSRPADIFDLGLHGAPLVLLLLKGVAVWRMRTGKD